MSTIFNSLVKPYILQARLDSHNHPVFMIFSVTGKLPDHLLNDVRDMNNAKCDFNEIRRHLITEGI